MNQTALQLISLTDPAIMEQSRKRYRELVTRPEEAPLPDRSGMDMSYIQQEEMRHWERNLDLMVQSGDLSEDDASMMLRNKQMELSMQGGI
jgi:3',5'-cyclic AMP phosphodiesterase CpdA